MIIFGTDLKNWIDFQTYLKLDYVQWMFKSNDFLF